MTKTNFFDPYNSPYSAANQAIQDYILLLKNHIQRTSTSIKAFVYIVCKKAKASIPDEPLLKDALALPKAKEWKRVMQIEYEVLLANKT